jgi:hypothetical protein
VVKIGWTGFGFQAAFKGIIYLDCKVQNRSHWHKRLFLMANPSMSCSKRCTQWCRIYAHPATNSHVRETSLIPTQQQFLTPIFEWYVIWCGSKNGHQGHKCFEVIGLCAQNRLIGVNSIVNMIGGIYMTTWWARESLILNEKFQHDVQNLRGKWLHARFGFANHRALIACFISYMWEVGVERKISK